MGQGREREEKEGQGGPHLRTLAWLLVVFGAVVAMLQFERGAGGGACALHQLLVAVVVAVVAVLQFEGGGERAFHQLLVVVVVGVVLLLLCEEAGRGVCGLQKTQEL